MVSVLFLVLMRWMTPGAGLVKSDGLLCFQERIMSNSTSPPLIVNYDSISDELHLACSDKPTIVHYTEHSHVALLLDERTRLWVGFHIEAVSEFIKPGLIGKFEMLKELWRDETLTDYSKVLILGTIVNPMREMTKDEIEYAKTLVPAAKKYLDGDFNGNL